MEKKKVKYKFNKNTLTFERVNYSFSLKNKLFQLIIVGAILFFIIGYSLVLLKYFDQNKFLSVAAIVGTIASIAGLLSFSSKKINKSDLENIGLEYLKDIVQTADKIKEKEEILLDKDKQLNNKEREIQKLEIKKAELEFIIKKASMTIFLKDQLERLENRIAEMIIDHKELSKSIQERISIIKKIQELGDNIELSENAELIDELVSLVKKKESNRPKEPLLINILNKFIPLLG